MYFERGYFYILAKEIYNNIIIERNDLFMANKKNNAPHDLQQTKGLFTFRGIVTGTDKDSFYKETTTKSGKPFRAVSFGVEFDKDKKDFISLNGMEKDNVFFSKRETVDGKTKVTTEKVAWKDRFTFKKEGFGIIGVGLGLEKTTDSNGKEVNKKVTLVEFDACDRINQCLEDGQSVFVKGNIEYSTYDNKHYTKFVPQQISLCSKDIDFEDEKFEANHQFTQPIVFIGISKDKDRFVVSAKVISYSSIEDIELVTYNSKLANNLKKLKPYTAITVWGDIDTVINTEEVEDEDDGWGESNKMTKVNSPFTREMVITGADPESIDTEIYSEESVESAIAKLANKNKADKEFGSNSDDDWGSVGSSSDDDEDDEWT